MGGTLSSYRKGHKHSKKTTKKKRSNGRKKTLIDGSGPSIKVGHSTSVKKARSTRRKANKGHHPIKQRKRSTTEDSHDDSGQGSSPPPDSSASTDDKKNVVALAAYKGLSATFSDNNESDVSCLYCSEDHYQQGNHDHDNQLLYCTKGSLCSRRSRATVMSKKVRGRRSRPPIISSSTSTSSSSSSVISNNIPTRVETVHTPQNKTKVTHFKATSRVLKAINTSGPSAASIQAFDDIVNGPFKTYVDLSKRIGSEVATISEMVEVAFKAQRAYLEMAAKAKQPPQGDLPMLLKPMSDKITEIQSYREAGRRCQYFNHLSAISESIPALGWVAVSPAPAPFVKEMNDAGQFYTNRVLKDWKEKSKAHVDWTKAWLQTLFQMQAFVKEYHTTGLVWNAKGGDAKSIANHGVPSAPPRAAAPSAGGPPPPPPPPPADYFDDLKITENVENKARNALFDELNQGDDVGTGLKKVTDDMKTHKNPNLRSSGPVPAKNKSASPKPVSSAKAAAPVKPPKLELEGRKWAVEYHKNNPNLTIEGTETNQSVYVYKCEGSTLKIEGKVNNIVVDGCKKTAVVFDNAVGSCEFINCQSVQMQVLGKVPTISIDKTDGCQMFLSMESRNTEIITAKSSEMNVMIPTGDEFVEQPIPEQFKTVINGVKLATSVTESV